MKGIPSTSAGRIVRALQRDGWTKVRQNKHILMNNIVLGRTPLVTIPNHLTVKRTTLGSILKAARMSVERFKELL